MGNNLGSPVVEDEDVDAGSILEDNRQDIYAKTGYNFPITPNFMEHFGADKIAFETPMPQLEPHTPHVPPSTPVVDAAHPVSPLFPLLVALRSIPNVGQSCYITTALHILARLEHVWLPQLAAADWSIYDPSFAKHVELISSSHDATGSTSSSTAPTPPTVPASPALSPLPSLLNLGFSTDALWFDHNWFSLLVRAQPQIARVRVGAECVPAATSEEDSDGLDIGVFSEEDTLTATGAGLDFGVDVSQVRAQHDHLAAPSSAPVHPLPLAAPTTADSNAAHAANIPGTVDKLSSGPPASSTSLCTHHGESVPRPPASHPRLAAPAALASLPAVPAAVQMFPPACALVLELLRVAALLNGRKPSLRVTSPYARARTDSANGAKDAVPTSTIATADVDGAGASVSVQPLLAVLPRSSGLAAFSHAKQGDCLEFLLSILAVVHYTAVVCAAAQRALRTPHPTAAPTLSLPAALSPLALMSDTVVTAFIAPRVWLSQLAALLCFEQRTRKICHCCVRLPAGLADTHTSPSCCAHRTASHTQVAETASSLSTPAACSELSRAVSTAQRRAGESGLSFDCLPAVRDMLHQLAQRCQHTHAANKGYLSASTSHLESAEWEQLCVRAPQGLRYSVALHADGRLCVSVATVSFLNVGLYCGRAGSGAISQSAVSTSNGIPRGQAAHVSSTTAGLATLTEAQELAGETADAMQAVRAAFEQSGWRRVEDDAVSVGVRVGKGGKVDVGVWLCGVRCEVRDVRDVRVVVGGSDEEEEEEKETKKEDVQEALRGTVTTADGGVAVPVEAEHSEVTPSPAEEAEAGEAIVVEETATQEKAGKAAVVDDAPAAVVDGDADCAVEAIAIEEAPQNEGDPSVTAAPMEAPVAVGASGADDGSDETNVTADGSTASTSEPTVAQWSDDVVRLTIVPYTPTTATATAAVATDGAEEYSAAVDAPVVLVRLVVRPYVPAPPQRSWWSWLFPSRAEPTTIATSTAGPTAGEASSMSALDAPMLSSTPPPSLEPIPACAAEGVSAAVITGEGLLEKLPGTAEGDDVTAPPSEADSSAPGIEDDATVADGATATVASTASGALTSPPPLCLSSLLRWHFPRLPLPALHEHHHAARCTWHPPQHPHETPLSLPLSSPLTLASGLLRSPDAIILRIDAAGNSSPYAQRRDSARGACGRACACSRAHGERSWWRWGNKPAPVAFPLDHSLTRPHNRWELPETSSSFPEKQNSGLMRVSQERYPRSSPQTPTPWYALQGLCLYTGTGASGHYKAVVRGQGGAWHIADGEDVQPVCVATDHVASEDVYFAVYSRRGADGEAWARAAQLAEGWR